MSGESPKRHAGMPCPVCQVDLLMSDRLGVEIDYCPKCRGVWLDRGELDKIIALSDRQQASGPQAAATNQAPQPQPSPGFLPQQGGPWAASPIPQGNPVYPPYSEHVGGHGGHGGHGGGHSGYGGHDSGSFLPRIFR